MLHLAIECSGIVGSVALFDDDLPLGQLDLANDKSSIQTMAPTIAKLVADLRDRPKLISVTNGPGSFTSLRVGLATAKMLALAWNIPVVGIDSLATIAYRTAVQKRSDAPSELIVIPVLNAFRKQVFTAAWKTSSSGFENLAQSQVLGAVEWCRQPLESLHFRLDNPEISNLQLPNAILTGPGLANYSPESLPTHITLAETKMWQPHASDVAQLGWNAFQNGYAGSAQELMPNYVRASAAEDNSQSVQ